MHMDKEVLEVVLKNHVRDRNIQRIIEVESTPALPKGENYCSVIHSLRVKAVLGNGRLVKRSFILKQIITKDKAGEWLKEKNIGKTEAEIYTVVHKEMTYLMEEFEDTEEPLWCKFYRFDPVSCSLLMEDLRAIGYKLIPRQEGMGMDHATLALRGLGRYHGMAKVLEERGSMGTIELKTNTLITDKFFINIMHKGIKGNSEAIQKHWDPRWRKVAEKLIVSYEKFEESLLKSTDHDDSDFKVLNHGDCWSNNMMFKYDWQNRPIHVKFLDYQMPNYCSPCMDVTNFLYLSLQPPVRRQNFDLLLKTYYDSFITTLDGYGHSGKRPSLQDLSEKMEQLKFFGLSTFFCFYACLVCEAKDAMDIEKMFAENQSGINPQVITEPGMEEKMGPDLVDFVEKYFSG